MVRISTIVIGPIPYVYPGRVGQEGVRAEARRPGDLPEVNSIDR